jgi:hypothetical protein
MDSHPDWSWGALLLLGAFHGVNPGMGWLFAVALGMQERRRSAVWQAMVALGIGHGLAVGAVLLLALLAGALIPGGMLRITVAIMLMLLGAYRLVRHRHPRWRAMRVGMVGLTAWSFLMASAHGAGLMVVPVVLAAPHQHDSHIHALADARAGLVATAVHDAGYLATAAIVAALCYEILGVAFLRKAWVNLDLVWAAALVVTGVVALMI